jgi:hypothetical protein
MGRPLYTNNAATYLAFGITNTATTMQVSANAGSLFPSPSGGDYFYISLISLSGPIIEIVQCTQRVGDVFTIVRGQEGTSAQYWNTGDNVQLRITAAGMNFLSGSVVTNTQVQEFTATQGQTIFTLTNFDYTPASNNLSVFVNGSKQVAGVNYSETSVNVFTFTSGLNAGDVVEAIVGLTTAGGTLSASLISYNEGGTGAATRTVQNKLQESVSVLDFGADPTGATNSAPAFQAAIAASLSIYIPPGTYTIGTTGSTGTLLYLGTNTGNPSRNGLKIYGAGVGNTTLKLANGVDTTALMFGAGTTDSLANMTFSDFTIDLNGANNNTNSIYNNAFYFYCPCTNITWEHIYFKNMASQQTIRVGKDTSAGYGNNITVKNCTFDTFGIGGGFSTTDISVLYLQANDIKVVNNTFTNPSFVVNPSIGHTAIEFNGDASTIIEGNYFTYVQLPVLIDSYYKNNTNIQIVNNNFYQCNYLSVFDSASTYDQKKVIISNNIFQSTWNVSSSIIGIASGTDASKVREDIVVENNIINCFNNTNQYVNVIYIANSYIRSLVIQNNDISGMNGALLLLLGAVKNTNYLDIIIKGNRLDSLGATSGANQPNTPSFVYVDISSGVGSGTINSLTISNNTLFNSSGKNYGTNGAFWVKGNINYTFIQNNENNLAAGYLVTTDGITSPTYKLIDSSHFQSASYKSKDFAIAGNTTTNLYNFVSWLNKDSAMFTLRLYVSGSYPSGSSTGVFTYQVSYSNSGTACTLTNSAGTYASNISIAFSGTTLQITSTTATTLTGFMSIEGATSLPINWLV